MRRDDLPLDATRRPQLAVRASRWRHWAIVLPAVVTALVALATAWHRERVALERSLQDTSRALALAVDREIATLEGIAWALAGSDELSAPSLDAFHRFAGRAAHRAGAWAVLVEHQPGGPSQQIMNTSVPLDTVLPRGRGLNQFDGWKEKTARLSDLFVGPANGGWVTAVTVPSARMRGDARLSVSVSTTPDRFLQLLVSHEWPDGWAAGVLDRAGRVVARVPDPQLWVGQLAPEGVRTQLDASDTGAFETTTFEGETATAYLARSPSYGWWFAIAVPRHHQRMMLLKSLLPVAAAMLLAVSLSVVVALRAGLSTRN